VLFVSFRVFVAMQWSLKPDTTHEGTYERNEVFCDLSELCVECRGAVAAGVS